MDRYTRMRYPHPIPYVESTVRPAPTAEEVRMRRIVLCGTANLGVLMQGSPIGSRQVWRSRKLAAAIRRYAA
jgi:hypothetical protein